MKNNITIKYGEKDLTLCFTIRALMDFEDAIGTSVVSLFGRGFERLQERLGVAFTVAGVRCGAGVTEDEAYNVIEEASAAGVRIPAINDAILAAVLASGLFLPKPETEEEESAQGEAEAAATV